jgi:hypothetical protein
MRTFPQVEKAKSELKVACFVSECLQAHWQRGNSPNPSYKDVHNAVV